jgi:hypothetical protein
MEFKTKAALTEWANDQTMAEIAGAVHSRNVDVEVFLQRLGILSCRS